MTLDRLLAVRQARQLGPTASLGIGGLQGATFNTGDEIYGALRGAGAALVPGGQGFSEAYAEGRDEVRDAYNRADPNYRLAGELMGAVATPGMGAAGFIARGAGALAKTGRAAAVGAGQGAAAGFGAGDSGLADRFLSAGEGAAVGGALGGGVQATLGRLIGRQAARTRPASDVAEGAREAEQRGIRQTRGQFTDDVEQLARENELRGARGPGPDMLRQFDEGQQQDIAAELMRTGQRVGGQGDLVPAAGDLVSTLQQRDTEARQAVQEAYDVVRSRRGEVLPAGASDALDGLQERFNSTVNDPVEGIGLNPETGEFLTGVMAKTYRNSGLPEAARVAELQEAFTNAVRMGDNANASQLQDELTQALAVAAETRPTIQKMEGLRQGLNTVWRKEADSQRKAGLGRMIEDFDDWLEDTVTSRLFEGDSAVLQDLRNARGLNRRYNEIFGTSGQTKPEKASDNLIQTLLSQEAGPDAAIRFLTGMQSIGGRGVPTAVRRIQRAAPEAFELLKVGHFQNMQVNARTGEPLTPNQIASNFQRFTQRQPALAKLLYGAKGAKDINGLAKALKATDRQIARTGNPSRSAYTAANLLRGFARTTGLAVGLVTNPQAVFATGLSEAFSNVEGILQARRAVTTQARRSRIGRTFRSAAPIAGAQVGRLGPSLIDDENAQGLPVGGLGGFALPGMATMAQGGQGQPGPGAPGQAQNQAILDELKSLRSGLEASQRAPAPAKPGLSPEEQALRQQEIDLRKIETLNQIDVLRQVEEQRAAVQQQAAMMKQQMELLQRLSDQLSQRQASGSGPKRKKRAVVRRDELGRMVDAVLEDAE